MSDISSVNFYINFLFTVYDVSPGVQPEELLGHARQEAHGLQASHLPILQNRIHSKW